MPVRNSCDIEKNYDPDTFGARINLEHLKSPWMPCFGDVLSVYTEEIKEGELAGKLGLYGVLSPTDELITMNKQRQKVYTPVEIDTAFADTGKAYLVGLAVKDNPASLGSSMLEFSHGKPHCLADRKLSPHSVFTTAEETLLEFIDETTAVPNPSLSLLEKVKALFGRERNEQTQTFSDIQQAKSEQQIADLGAALTVLKNLSAEKHQQLKTELTTLTATLAQEETPTRPASLGRIRDTDTLTNC
ncbi:GPO family capsid scaffolding protein [Candidatus Arsenophonus triatominarum]|uniref:GPO family capsid scaffolding protein n=1 Tax=Candidatus Arsenophonus triatominarum TaxID=57911 RepID=UPI0007C48E40|nr:GPO family capsid scaffolding protein [Candidatus Arsenophonus triatominarum]